MRLKLQITFLIPPSMEMVGGIKSAGDRYACTALFCIFSPFETSQILIGGSETLLLDAGHLLESVHILGRISIHYLNHRMRGTSKQSCVSRSLLTTRAWYCVNGLSVQTERPGGR